MKFLVTALITLAFSTAALAVSLPPAVQAMHKALTENGCNPDAEEPVMYKISDTVNLHIVPCYMGAYQGTGNVYLENTAYKTVEPVSFLTYSELAGGIVGNFNFGDPSYEPETSLLYSFSKGRGLADCGDASISKVVTSKYGVAVKTIEIRHKAKCDGGDPGDWPVVFRQK
jgi:hypothetical protein